MVDTRCLVFCVVTNASVGEIFNSNGTFHWCPIAKHDSLHRPLEIIHANELKKGKAQILTAIDGEAVDLFDSIIDK